NSGSYGSRRRSASEGRARSALTNDHEPHRLRAASAAASDLREIDAPGHGMPRAVTPVPPHRPPGAGDEAPDVAAGRVDAIHYASRGAIPHGELATAAAWIRRDGEPGQRCAAMRRPIPGRDRGRGEKMRRKVVDRRGVRRLAEVAMSRSHHD